jgi:hypothetical protein
MGLKRCRVGVVEFRENRQCFLPVTANEQQAGFTHFGGRTGSEVKQKLLLCLHAVAVPEEGQTVGGSRTACKRFVRPQQADVANDCFRQAALLGECVGGQFSHVRGFGKPTGQLRSSGFRQTKIRKP